MALRVLASPLVVRAEGNPYVKLLYQDLDREYDVQLHQYSNGLARQHCHIIHIHWPEWVMRAKGTTPTAAAAMQFLRSIRRARKNGTRIIWTLHNLQPHETDRLGLMSYHIAAFARSTDFVISFSDVALQMFKEQYPALRHCRSAVIPHGTYRGFYPDRRIAKAEARRRLGVQVDGKILLFIGQIRPYKNVPDLIRRFRDLRTPRTTLIVAGEAKDPALVREIEAEARLDSRVHLRLGLIPNDQLQYFLRSCDTTIVPITDGVNSGSAMLALSFDRPVIAPHRGSLIELQQDVGNRWVRTYNGPVSTSILERMMIDEPPDTSPQMYKFDWASIRRATYEAYQAAIRQQ